MSDLVQVLAMMAAVVAFFGTIRYLNVRAARIENRVLAGPRAARLPSADVFSVVPTQLEWAFLRWPHRSAAPRLGIARQPVDRLPRSSPFN